MAAFNGWTIGFVAAVSILFGVLSRTSFLVGVGLALVARNELVGRRRLRSLEPSGLELLWRNQLGLMALVIAYCGWSIYRTIAVPSDGIDMLTESLGADVGELAQGLTVIVYAVVIVATGIFQGLNALYYFVRVARIRDYVRDTPPWVLEMQRSTVLE